MKIRSITYFCNPKYPLDEKVIQAAGKFLARAKSAYEAASYEVQTVRLATIPFPKLLGEKQINDLPKLAEQLEKLIQPIGIGHLSVGPALPESPRGYQVIPEAIAASQNIFFDGVMADKSIGISLVAIKACAEVMVKSAPIDPNGFANLRFAALANVKAGAPFFPAAYHDNDEPAFAIATEAADLAVDAFSQAKTLEMGRQTLIAEIEKHGKQLSKVAQSLDCKFGGVDFSLGPFPAEAQSLGTAFERMGVPRVGLHGSLAAAAILTEAIDRANFPRTGFSGLMMPVLEDATLAKRAADGTLSVKDVLLYSAVCGTGLDTIPLPGDTTADQIVPLLLDLSALALRLDKPLTARLMPVPGKKAGDPTNFDFGFFANSKVMSLDAMPLNTSLAGDETFSIQSRRK
ncbi:MAG TPA: DUF711 family protein [Anaerolineales bacterium]